MKGYKKEKGFSYDGKRIKWPDSYEMLRIFTKNVVGQSGNWQIQEVCRR